jgi:hypothetical protein
MCGMERGCRCDRSENCPIPALLGWGSRRKSQNVKNTRAKVPGMLALILFVVSVIATLV